jgi:DNA-binding MarR family transcriptional regulator
VINTARAVDGSVRRHGVSFAQWAVLNQLAEQPGLSGAELARTMLITPQAAHQALTTLDRAGLVERKPDPNHRRIIRAVLTEAGRDVADRCRADTIQVEHRVLGTFDTKDQWALLDLLQRYVQQFTTPREA